MSAVEKLSCPPVSIILAVRNEETHLERCLESVAAQDYPAEMIEIILVDGMSTDRTGQIIADWQKRDRRIRSFENADRIVSTAVNIGIKESRYDLILWVSGHALLQADHLRKCVETMHSTGAAAVGGVLTTKGVGRIGKLNAAVLSHPFGVGNAAHRVGRESGWVPAVTMALYKKGAILDVGGFDQSLPRSQDNDLHDRMNKRGYKSYMDVSINPRYLCRGSYGGLLKQAWQNGFWNVMLSRTGRRGFSLRHFVPMAFILSLIALAICSLLSESCHYLLFGVLLIYLVVASVVSLSIGIKKRLSWPLLLLPFFFLSLHVTYGLASCAALFSRKLRQAG